MKRKRWLAVLGASATMAALTGCRDQEVRDYLGATGEMVAWQTKLAKAVCQLETKYQQSTGGLDPAKRICPNGEGGGSDDTHPPKFPPK